MFPEFWWRLLGADRQLYDQTRQRSGDVSEHRLLRRYRWPELNPAISRENENRDVKKQNGDGFGTSLTYDFGGSDFAISGAYTNSDRTNEQNLQSRGTGKRAEAWATGLKYDANNIYLATFYSETRKMTPISGGFANKTQNFEAVAQYQFDFGLRPSLGYVLSKGKDIEGIGDEDLVNYVDVGATYYFNKNMSAFVDYKINQLDSDNKLNINNDDIVAVGMTYQF